VVFSFLAMLFTLVGIILFGVHYENSGNFHWSFVFACIGSILAFVGGALSLWQMKKSGLCHC